MGLLDQLTKLKQKETIPTEEKTKNKVYEDLQVMQPFTILVGGQFNSFIARLGENNKKTLNQTEQEAFGELWNAAGIDVGGTGNNLWSLRKGNSEIYNKDGIVIRFEKKDASVKDKYGDSTRTTFEYLSEEGNFVINQNDRNNRVFLVYVSENISDRLRQSLRDAEIYSLDLEGERELPSGNVQQNINLKNNTTKQSISGRRENYKEDGEER